VQLAEGCEPSGGGLARGLGPLARLSVRVDEPVVRLAAELWDRAGLRLLLWLVRPAGRLVRWLGERVRRLVPSALRAVVRLLRAVEPVADWLAASVRPVEHTAARMRCWLNRRFEPLRRRVHAVLEGWRRH